MKCTAQYRGGTLVYYVDGKEVTAAKWRKCTAIEAREDKREKQRGRRFKAPGCFGDFTEWRFENGGKGRYCPQLGRYQKDPEAYCQSRKDLIEKGKRRGLTVSHAN